MNTLAAPLAARVATPVIPAGRLPSMGLRAQLLWTARVRVLWLLGLRPLLDDWRQRAA